MTDQSQVEIVGTKVEITNLNKVFYPKTGFTKGQVIDYYIRVSPYLLPHLQNRPITLKRYPDGVEGLFFYEKKCPSHRLGWIITSQVARSKGCPIAYCVLDNLP